MTELKKKKKRGILKLKRIVIGAWQLKKNIFIVEKTSLTTKHMNMILTKKNKTNKTERNLKLKSNTDRDEYLRKKKRENNFKLENILRTFLSTYNED